MWWTRVETRMLDLGITPAELARRTGIHEKLIYKYLKGVVENPRGDVLARLARELGVSEPYLRHGDVMKIASQPAPLPLLFMSSLARLTRVEDVLVVWDRVSFVSASFAGSAASFVVRVDNECALPDFKPGDDILCDPEAPLIPGRLVFAVLPAKNTAIFGRFRPMTLGETYPFVVEPINPSWPTIRVDGPDHGFVLARAIRHIRDI